MTELDLNNQAELVSLASAGIFPKVQLSLVLNQSRMQVPHVDVLSDSLTVRILRSHELNVERAQLGWSSAAGSSNLLSTQSGPGPARWGFKASACDPATLEVEPSAVRRLSGSAECVSAVSDFRMESGRHYWEVVCAASGQPFINVGICAAQCDSPSNFVSSELGYGLLCATGGLYHQDKHVRQLCSPLASGDVIGMLLDCERGQLKYWLNGAPVGVGFDSLPSQCYLAAVSLWQQGDAVRVSEVSLPGPLRSLGFDHQSCSSGVTVATDNRAVRKSSKVAWPKLSKMLTLLAGEMPDSANLAGPDQRFRFRSTRSRATMTIWEACRPSCSTPTARRAPGAGPSRTTGTT